MHLVKVTCAHCGKKFFREFGRVNEANKFGWNQYCSKKCQNQAQVTKLEKVCGNPNCNKRVSRELSQFKQSKSSLIFCSSSCAAIFNNLSRKKLKTCSICNKQFYGERKYCSNLCRANAINPRKIPPEMHKEKVIARIVDFYHLKGRIPVKREMYGMYRTTRDLFGSWNKAITAAGFSPNPVLFAQRFIANDGHECDSFAEKIIDDWLYEKRIKHKRRVPYPEIKSLTADFITGTYWIEYFGLAGVINDYDKLIKKKRMLSKKYKLPLIEIYPKDLFPINHLSEIIKVKKI